MTREGIAKEFEDFKENNNLSFIDDIEEIIAKFEWLEDKIIELDKQIIKEI